MVTPLNFIGWVVRFLLWVLALVLGGFLLIVFLSAVFQQLSAAVETTTISGKVIMPSGVVASAGTVRATLSTQGGTPDGAVINFIGGSASAVIATDGTLTAFSLVPNDAITPAGTTYEIVFDVTAPIRTSWTVHRIVPSSPDPVDIGALTSTDLAPGLTPIICMNFLSAHWNPDEAADGFVSLAGGSPSQNASEAAVDDVLTPYALRFSTMRAQVDVAPGGATGWALTLRAAGAATAAACTMTGATATCTYTGASVTVAAGTKIDLGIVRTGTPAAAAEMLVSVCGAP